MCARLLGLLLLVALAGPARTASAEARGERGTLQEAERAIERGRYPEARAKLAPLVRKQRPRALALDGRIHRLQGEREAAAQRFRAVVALHQRGAISARNGEALWALAEATEGLGAYRDASESFARAVAASPERIEIELAWADLFLEKHALDEAQESLSRVLARDPRNARALERLARVELERGAGFAAVEARLQRALESAPGLAAAHVTRAGLALRDEDLALADAHLDRALAQNPRDLEALSVRAAVRFVADDAPGFAEAVRRVLAENPRFSRLYSIVGTYAEWEHRYAELVQLSDAALHIDRDDAYAHALRGINLLRIGSEAEGLAALREAWARDRYNEQVYNLLELYDGPIARDYETIEAPPFLVRMPRRERAMLAPYAIPLLLRAHETLRTRYGFRPSTPTYVELYAVPAQFAIRATGLPQLGVQGICFGNTVIALSPRGGEVSWGQIVWHELSHVFHVQLSRGRVPRWFTEGLAEYETSLAQPEWKREDDRPLYDALMSGTLPPLAALNRAFTHARRPEELTVAYYASTLAVGYLAERFGFDAIRRMLALWGEGLATDEVVERALGTSLEQLDGELRASLATRLTPRYAHDLRIDVTRYRDLASFRARSAAPAAGPDEHAGLALALAEAGELEAARARASALLAETPGHALAGFTLAHVALKLGDLAEGARALEALRAHGHDGYQLGMLRGRIAWARGDAQGALRELAATERLDPTRTEAYALQAEVAEQAGDAVAREHALTRLVALDQHAREPLVRLLALLRARGAYDALVPLARAGLYRDVHDAAIHAALADGLLHTGSLNEAHDEAERALALARGDERAGASALLRAVEAQLALARRGMGAAQGTIGAKAANPR